MLTVTYNRRLKQYEMTDPAGAVLQTWPGGPDGRAAAVCEAIRRSDPQAHAAALHLTQTLFPHRGDLHARIWRAAELVARGAVAEPYHLNDEPHAVARVQSQRCEAGAQTPRRYAIHLVPDADTGTAFYTCDCRDYTGTEEEPAGAPAVHGRKLCKHILAVLLHGQLRRPPAADLPDAGYSPRQLHSHRTRRLAWLQQFGPGFTQPVPVPDAAVHVPELLAAD